VTSKEYYDQYLKKDKHEGICKICGEETKFIDLSNGYRVFCSKRCANFDYEVQNKIQETKMANQTTAWQLSLKKEKKQKEFECPHCHRKFEIYLGLSHHLTLMHDRKKVRVSFANSKVEVIDYKEKAQKKLIDKEIAENRRYWEKIEKENIKNGKSKPKRKSNWFYLSKIFGKSNS
jgi:endogenous inhibitor of DNA gyrase (YacG/DUF329 family)